MENTTPEYPQYYRLANRAIKRDSDTSGFEVKVPEQNSHLPTSHGPVVFPDKERFDAEVEKMEPCDKDMYESYLFTFFQAADRNRAQLNKVRDRRYVDAKGL